MAFVVNDGVMDAWLNNLGIKDTQAYRIVIDMKVGEVAKVYVECYGDESMLELGLPGDVEFVFYEGGTIVRKRFKDGARVYPDERIDAVRWRRKTPVERDAAFMEEDQLPDLDEQAADEYDKDGKSE